MTLVWRPGFAYDTDASAYIDAVEAADQIASPGIGALETATRYAINDFVLGCKNDGIWSAIKASCILAGARTLAGALVPLAGTAPNRFGTEGGWNYNRKIGLKGNGTNNYINTNRLDSVDPQNLFSMSLYMAESGNNGIALMGSGPASYCQIATTSIGSLDFYNRSSTSAFVGANTGNQFLGSSRSNSANFTRRYGGLSNTLAATSAAANGRNIFVYADNNSGTAAFISTARLAFYSIGESLNLDLLDARVTDLINAFAVAIP